VTTLTSAPVYDAATVARLFSITFSDAELAGFGSPPPGLNRYVTFFDPGWSILCLRTLVAHKGTVFYPQDWYYKEPFAAFTETPRYHQVRMEALEDSFGKTFAEQQALVPPDEEIPTARVVLMAVAIHFLATGERLFQNNYVRCGDEILWDSLVSVGHFGPDGVRIAHGAPNFSPADLGVVLSGKL
jgi:hypothetical protein